uniref:Four helix bundle protein n=1 Tax=candidate division CPR3 bacterium TaxID=2268181 RepID=A0A7C4M2L9_UNCC3
MNPNQKDYINLGNLDVYKLALDLSIKCWDFYKHFDWETRKIEGTQFIRSIDSIGANIAEGYGRFHYLDRIRFYYNSRGSLLESKHWVFLLYKREKISKIEYDDIISKLNNLHVALNVFIGSCYQSKNNISIS